MTTLSQSSYPEMAPLGDPYYQGVGQSGMANSWNMDCNVDMTLGSPGTRSGTPGSRPSTTPSPIDGSSRSPKFCTSGSSMVGPITMVGSPETDTICALVDEEFLNHYRVREIMESLKYSSNYHSPQTAMFAASAYYDYYDTYPGKVMMLRSWSWLGDFD